MLQTFVTAPKIYLIFFKPNILLVSFDFGNMVDNQNDGKYCFSTFMLLLNMI